MDNKICSECGTENEAKYIYCKNCGAPLVLKNEKFQKQPENETADKAAGAPEFNGYSDANTQPENNTGADSYGTAQEYGGNQSESLGGGNSGFAQGVYSPEPSGAQYGIEGIPAEDIAFFVGKKAGDILPKFTSMEFSGSKVSWCWPAALLGFFFGPMGAAIWFLYRKMYKIGALLLVLGAALTFFLAALSYNPSAVETDDLFDAFTSGDVDLLDDLLIGEETVLSRVADLIDMATGVACCILSGIFGFYAYKEHCVKAIRNYRMTGIDPRYYRIGLASVGGVSGGMVAVGIVCIIVASNISTLITYLMSFI